MSEELKACKLPTLDEAIDLCKNRAEELKNFNSADEHMQIAMWLEELRAYRRAIPDNPQLTLDELRQMNNEPVYIVDLEEPDSSAYRILHWDRGKYLVLVGICSIAYLLDDYGKTWLVYRHKPKEAQSIDEHI